MPIAKLTTSRVYLLFADAERTCTARSYHLHHRYGHYLHHGFNICIFVHYLTLYLNRSILHHFASVHNIDTLFYILNPTPHEIIDNDRMLFVGYNLHVINGSCLIYLKAQTIALL